MRIYTTVIVFLMSVSSCQSQTESTISDKTVGGPCEGCEAIYEFGDKKLISADTLPGFEENGPKIKITGAVYKNDGTTLAENVILYVYQTNRKGIYEKNGDEEGWARRHGFIRGWVKTDKNGRYAFYTFRPASYPNSVEPEHIHLTVKEPGKNEYYIDEFLFDDDPLLTSQRRNELKGRGGSGILKLQLDNGILTARRDIILGFNIPNY